MPKIDLTSPKKRLDYIEATNPGFIAAVEAMAARLKTKPEYLLATMDVESKLRPDVWGSEVKSGGYKGQKAVGLIQFMPDSAKNSGTTQEELAKMTPLQQLPYVEAFLRMKANTLHYDGFPTLRHVSNAVFGTGKSDGYATQKTRDEWLNNRLKSYGAEAEAETSVAVPALTGKSVLDRLYAPAKRINTPLLPPVSGSLDERAQQLFNDISINDATFGLVYPNSGPAPEGWTVEGDPKAAEIGDDLMRMLEAARLRLEETTATRDKYVPEGKTWENMYL
jgi:hypothetical protein